MAKPVDKAISDIKERTGEKRSGFSDKIVWDCDIVPTIRAATAVYSADTKSAISKETMVHAQTFPEDYDFLDQNPFYVCGMSVPPVMIKRIVQRILESRVL
jgi:DNA (cytosine-5)-methyltransferase 1